jgi:TonB family protein
MNADNRTGTLLRIPLIQERYGASLLASVGIHGIIALLLVFGGSLMPTTAIQFGSGPGGGSGGDISSVGVVDELSGGAGMFKPSIVPRPPALREKPVPKDESKAIPLPRTLEPKKKKPETRESARTAKVPPDSSLIPTAPEPGSGGSGGRIGGSGGGVGGGTGVSIGTGSGGFGDSLYARTVENRISSNWIRPPEGYRVEIVYSFLILPNGSITNIKLEKSSGNSDQDRNAERAIQALKYPLLPAPPPEFRGRPIQFVAQFIYPPNQ